MTPPLRRLGKVIAQLVVKFRSARILTFSRWHTRVMHLCMSAAVQWPHNDVSLIRGCDTWRSVHPGQPGLLPLRPAVATTAPGAAAAVSRAASAPHPAAVNGLAAATQLPSSIATTAGCTASASRQPPCFAAGGQHHLQNAAVILRHTLRWTGCYAGQECFVSKPTSTCCHPPASLL